jgi:hypothetical protein
MLRRLTLIALGLSLFGAPTLAAPAGDLAVEGTSFVVTAAAARLTSKDLVGAVFEVDDGRGGLAEVRIDAVTPAKENAAILLHTLSARNPKTGEWRNMCEPDAYGRRAGFPLKGHWDGYRFVADPATWFLACTSGSQGKCVLWGYDPWGKGPDGGPLTDLYRTCQQTVRADYRGDGAPHTKNGTEIDIADVAGVQHHDSLADPAYIFEAGWGPAGAVCVAATRWPDLLTEEALVAASPNLGATCDEATARARGALIFTRIKRR